METRHQPAPQVPPPSTPPRPARPPVESSRAGVLVRVSVLDDHLDEEEKEAGYGHGV